MTPRNPKPAKRVVVAGLVLTPGIDGPDRFALNDRCLVLDIWKSINVWRAAAGMLIDGEYVALLNIDAATRARAVHLMNRRLVLVRRALAKVSP